jgi:hypothetical protein
MLSNDLMNPNIPFYFDDKDRQSLEKNHTHFLLLDDGKYCSAQLDNETNQSSTTVTNSQSRTNRHDQRQTDFAETTKYPKEMQRSDFVDHACREDKSESSFMLFYLSDISFFTGYAVTIIVEGGINTCLAVLNDIQMKRPVIFIQVLVDL